VGALVLRVGLQALVLEQRVALLEVEQGARRDGDDQAFGNFGRQRFRGVMAPQSDLRTNCSSRMRSSRVVLGIEQQRDGAVARLAHAHLDHVRTSCESAVALTGRL
jgi:hypothetical protein